MAIGGVLDVLRERQSRSIRSMIERSCSPAIPPTSGIVPPRYSRSSSMRLGSCLCHCSPPRCWPRTSNAAAATATTTAAVQASSRADRSAMRSAEPVQCAVLRSPRRGGI